MGTALTGGDAAAVCWWVAHADMEMVEVGMLRRVLKLVVLPAALNVWAVAHCGAELATESQWSCNDEPRMTSADCRADGRCDVLACSCCRRCW